MRLDASKKLSAATIKRNLTIESNLSPIKINAHIVEVHKYRGHVIKEWEELVPGGGRMCYIGFNDEGLAARRGLEAAKHWVDHNSPHTPRKNGIRCRRVKSARTQQTQQAKIVCKRKGIK